MNIQDSISMNSSRPFEDLHQQKNDKSNQNYKELILEKDQTIKDLIDKSEKMEKEYLKLQINLRTTEEKLKQKMEKNYVVKFYFNF